MEKDSKLEQLLEKARSGKSTPEEDLALLQQLNSAMRMYLAFTDELLAIKARQSAPIK